MGSPARHQSRHRAGTMEQMQEAPGSGVKEDVEGVPLKGGLSATKNASLPVTSREREYEVFTVVPMRHLPNDASFAPNQPDQNVNSGGAVKEVEYGEDPNVELKLRGSGTVELTPRRGQRTSLSSVQR
ncbi:hypothetical protein PR202_ga21366 [Eleusine coracana subsp. coracana]|uniref:Uncharacterized protein n=1 Tax=Eleusine coracana subsp. coracana TaxID=191504 RepID=A0AAV5D0C1_ELECO|nr:hypothetical protein PR202_ga21366 [Eleusine coracana subsp. coracana]